MKFEWDETKARSNLLKHEIAFEDAVYVFDDPFILNGLDRFAEGEERWEAIGSVGGTLNLFVSYTIRHEGLPQEAIRIISARRATPHEKRRYEQERR